MLVKTLGAKHIGLQNLPHYQASCIKGLFRGLKAWLVRRLETRLMRWSVTWSQSGLAWWMTKSLVRD
jgi:hypothetical protein